MKGFAKRKLKSLKRFVHAHGKDIAGISLGLLVIVGGVLIHEQHALAVVGPGGGGTYSLDLYYAADSEDDSSPPPDNSSTCGTFAWCNNPSVVGSGCDTHTQLSSYQCYGDTPQDYSCGNVLVQSFVCDYHAPACVADDGQVCPGPANSCGTVTNGTYNCTGVCSQTTAPANPANLGSACNSAQNSCGMYNSGTTQCNSTCSATTPSNSLCTQQCTANSSCAASTCAGSSCEDSCGNYYSGTEICAQQCIANNSCAATTCTTSTCQDSCGNVYTGTEACAQQNPGNGGNSCTDTGPDTLKVSPSLVPNNSTPTIKFTFSISNASAGCTLSGLGVSTTTGTPTSCSAATTTYQTSSVTFTGPATYTLSCPGGETATAIVRTVPSVQED